MGQLTPSQFISFVAAAVLLIDPINLITENYNKFKQGETSIDRVQALLNLPPHPEPKHAQPLPQIRGEVEFRQVSFAYQPQQPVLQDLSFQVRAGETVALIGPSGVGKSTLAHLLLRLYQPAAGQILIDGMDLQFVTRQSLYQQIGIVSQHTHLFSGTICQNIAYGHVDFDLAQVQKAAEVANASDFIQQLPQGLHTYLGEQGTTLSGGQRQRIAIARAVFHNPRILILDEATSALDTESEALVQTALENLMCDGQRPTCDHRTVILIAHRLTTVLNADRIFVVEQGHIVESGTHQQLIANGTSRYASLYAQQLV